jgi:peptide/nickel transport system permease protein
VGGTVIILIPLVAATIGLLVGGSLGMLGAYRGGQLDGWITRAFDLLLAVPPLLVVLIAVAALGNSDLVLVGAVVTVWIPRQGRIVRGATQAHITSEFVDAAKARGERTHAILFREVLPNIVSPTLADYALRITQGVIYVATLNYLGLGIQPPTADWGAMVAEGQTFIAVAPIGTLAPAAAIAWLSISINLIADAMTRHVTHDTSEVIPL